ncbi:MAG: helix-turn-helix domain-containing protein [Candidatus Gastranaerophilales bacterium]|nr:helix-turn-helix domain-containing protein [Candidatus Gastranaerophilales bacterium]
MDSLKKKFGKRIKELRKSKKLTQEQIAERISIEPPNISKMENGLHFPQPENIEKLANALNVEIKDLFDFEHLQQKQTLTNEINEYLSSAKIQDVEFVYKFICNLKQYK